ncbi:unnamed protein product [Ectocarpus sp. 12 AP-2014]
MQTHTRVFRRCGISTAVGCIFLSVVLRNSRTTITEHVRELLLFAPEGHRIVCCRKVGRTYVRRRQFVQQRPLRVLSNISPRCTRVASTETTPSGMATYHYCGVPPSPLPSNGMSVSPKRWLHSSPGVLSCVIRKFHLHMHTAAPPLCFRACLLEVQLLSWLLMSSPMKIRASRVYR